MDRKEINNIGLKKIELIIGELENVFRYNALCIVWKSQYFETQEITYEKNELNLRLKISDGKKKVDV